MVYANNANLLEENTNIMKKDTDVLTDGIKERGPEADADKTKYMCISYQQTTQRQNRL